MSKMIIVEGNSNDKDNVRTIMVKGEKGDQGDLNHNDIIDNLTSTATDKVLSANQGKILKDLIDENQDTGEETYATKVELNTEASTRANADTNLQSQITGLASGSPLVASSTSEMTDTTRVYVNTADGYWYYYNGTQWLQGGVYQASQDSQSISELEKGTAVQKWFFDDYTIVKNARNDQINSNSFGAIARKKTMEKNGYVTKIKIYCVNPQSVPDQNQTIRLCKFTLNGTTVVDFTEDLFDYRVFDGENEILIKPFYVETGYYIGYQILKNNENSKLYVKSVYPSSLGVPGIYALTTSNTNVDQNLNNFVVNVDFEISNEVYINRYYNPLLGKTYIAYGDSITSGYNLTDYVNSVETNNKVKSYPRLFGQLNGMKYYNFGYAGQGYSIAPGSRAYELIRDHHISNIDIVSLSFGTNDYEFASNYNIPFGDITDNSDIVSFCGRVRKAFEMAVTYYPMSSIFVILPIPRAELMVLNGINKTLKDYSEAIEIIAKDYGFPTLDMLKECNMNIQSITFKSTYFIESNTNKSLHPTQEAQELFMLPVINDFIVKHFL